MSSTPDIRRNLPSVDSLLRSAMVERLLSQGVPRSRMLSWIRKELETLRDLKSLDPTQDDLLSRLQENLEARWQADSLGMLNSIVNATGVILHTNLGRAPLALSVSQKMQEVSSYCNIELDLETGHRGGRSRRVAELFNELTGAEDCLVVNNCAAATWLAIQTIVGSGEAIVSRGQLVEIGGSYRLPEIAKSAGIQLCEVGTTNRTYLRDYESEIRESTRALLRIHRSNFVISGFVCEPALKELVELGQLHAVCVIDDLGSGSLHNLSGFGLTDPTVRESVKTGADLVLFSGDKLLGGPQCGIILGRAQLIDSIRTNPLARALRVGKSILAGLEATLEIHASGNAFQDIPILRMLATPNETLRERSQNIVSALSSSSLTDSISVCELSAQMGGGTLPEQHIGSIGLKVSVRHPNRFAQLLRTCPQRILSRVSAGDVLLDLRAVHEEQDELLIAALKSLSASIVSET